MTPDFEKEFDVAHFEPCHACDSRDDVLQVTNRRTYPRYRVRLPLRVRCGQGRFRTVYAIDAGPGGVYLQMTAHPREGTPVELELPLATGPTRIRGVITWQKRAPQQLLKVAHGGCGVQFLGSAPPEWYQYCMEQAERGAPLATR